MRNNSFIYFNSNYKKSYLVTKDRKFLDFSNYRSSKNSRLFYDRYNHIFTESDQEGFRQLIINEKEHFGKSFMKKYWLDIFTESTKNDYMNYYTLTIIKGL